MRPTVVTSIIVITKDTLTMQTFIKNTPTGQAREVRFLRPFKATLAAYLPETSSPLFPMPSRWHTYRLRPEAAQAIEAMQVRYQETHGGTVKLTPSEVIAAALIEALPIMTAKPDFYR
jgi:hypothetical protein